MKPRKELKRSEMRRRHSSLRSSGKPGRKPRKASEFARVYGSKQRVAWVKAQSCVYCAGISPFFGLGESHNAHVCGNDGMGRKGDYTTIVPLCPSHHRRFDEHRPPFDDEKMRQAVRACAPLVEEAWQATLTREIL